MSGFRHLSDQEIAQLARVRVVQATFEAPDGSTFVRDVIRNEAVVAVVPVHDDGMVTMVRQYRGPIDSDLLEIPAGLCDVAGEDPVETAVRELEEEAGLVAEHWELVAAYYPSAGFSDQFVRMYLATGLTQVDQRLQGIEEEHLTVERVPLDEAGEMIADGRLRDSKSMIGLLLARDRYADRRDRI